MMATYYPGLSSERVQLQSPYPGDQKLSYSKLPSSSSAAGSYLEILPGSSLSSFGCTEFPSVGTRNELAFILPPSDALNLQSVDAPFNIKADNLVGNSVNGDPQLVSRALLGSLDGAHNWQPQGLSLGLGTQLQSALSVPSFLYQYPNPVRPSLLSTDIPALGKQTLSSEVDEDNRSKEIKNSACLPGFNGCNHNTIKAEASHYSQHLVSLKDVHTDASMYKSSVYASTSLNSAYIKAAQHLLDEVVNVRKALNPPSFRKCLDDPKETEGRSSSNSVLSIPNCAPSHPSESIPKASSEPPPIEQLDLKNRKTRLLSMLDEVDRKYKQYYHHMQIVVSSFDRVAGRGAAKSYTALALQTISRHFRCLCDAIRGQIHITRKRLGEQDISSNVQGGIPRLHFVDRQVRQQRALQQLRVVRHSWRPQRGLPESSVSVLRAWLFEHFLHPYPNDSEKLVLARQTGLTRSQVANWFINARVRLWKPMVEDIYKEEFGELETNSKSSMDDDATKAYEESHLPSENKLEELQDSLTSTAANDTHPGKVHELKSGHVPDIEMKKPMAKTVLQSGSDRDNFTNSRVMKFQCDKGLNMDFHNLYPDENIPCEQNGDGNLMSAAVKYDVSECGVAVGSELSLALQLQCHDSDRFPMFI